MKPRSWIILLSFLIALALDVLPLPTWVVWLRPSWTLLVLIYWVMVMPYRASVGFAFVLGLLLDLLQGTVLGVHALPMVLVAYCVAKLHRRFKNFPMRQQMLVIFLLVLFYKAVIFMLQGVLGHLPSSWLYWLSIVVSTLLWPWMFILLQDWRSRLHFEV